MSDMEDDPDLYNLLESLYGSDDDEEDNAEAAGSEEEKTKENEEAQEFFVSSLLDLAARVTGKHYSCSQLESQQNPPLDEVMLKKIAFWAFPQEEMQIKVFACLNDKTDVKWQDGEKLYNSNKIFFNVQQIGFMVNGIVSEETACSQLKEIAAVTLSFEKQRITATTCSGCHSSVWCRHVNAVLIHRIRQASKIPVHAPLTEMLYTLQRDQLQKIVQYAIKENPGAVLGKVFQHIESARDRQSDMNQQQGAPDPTFGLHAEETQIMEITLEKLDTSLMESLKNLRYSTRDYPDSSDFVQKADSNFHQQFFKKVIDLVNNGEMELAGEILIKIASACLDELSRDLSMGSSIKRAFHDTERLFTCFITAHTGPVREKLIRTAHNLNGIARNITAPDRFLKISEWSDISCLKLDSFVVDQSPDGSNTAADILEASSTDPFFQPLCASLIVDAPQSLKEILSGNGASALATSYDEPLAVLMLRFDWLLHTGCFDSNKELCKLGIVILRRLIYLTHRFSITSPMLPTHNIKTTGTKTSHRMNTNVSEDSDNDGPSSPKKSRCSDTTVPTEPREETSTNLGEVAASQLWLEVTDCDVDMDIDCLLLEPPDSRDKELDRLSKGQLSHCLLYVCYSLYQIKDMILVCDFELVVVMNATLRAIEMGRFRCFAPKDSISGSEYSWLLEMENKVQDAYLRLLLSDSQSVKDAQKLASQVCSSSLRKNGFNFYGNYLPLKLLVLLLKQGQMDKKMSLWLCVEAVCFSVTPLQGLNIPEEFMSSKNLDDMKRLWSTVIEILFQPYLKEDNTEQYSDAISQVLQHLGTVEDCSFCMLAFDVVYNNTLPTKMTYKHQDLFLKFIIHSIKQSNLTGYGKFPRCKLFETIKEIGPTLQKNFPAQIFAAWHDIAKYFDDVHIFGIAKVMKEFIKKDGSSPPREITELVFRYFEGSFKHDDESCELLNCMSTDFLRQEALKKIIGNSCNYTPNALFLIAKMEHESDNTKGKAMAGAQHGSIFKKDVFMLILFAFHRINELHKEDSGYSVTSDIKDHLNWCFVQIKENEQVRSGSQYAVFIEKLVSTFKDDDDVLIKFLKKMSECKPLLNRAKVMFGSKLVDCYKTKFFNRMHHCPRSSYNSVLRSMSEARKFCIEFVENGGRLFKMVIIDPIRRLHKGKRKFLMLMNQNHIDLLQENNELPCDKEV